MKCVMILAACLMLSGCVGASLQDTEGTREITATLYDGPIGKIGVWSSKFDGKYKTPLEKKDMSKVESK